MKIKKPRMDDFTAMRALFWASAGFLFLNAASFLFMPAAAGLLESGGERWGLAAVGAVFWASAALGYALLAVSNRYRRKLAHDGSDMPMGGRVGLVTFFSTVPGAAADSVFAASLAALVIVSCTGRLNSGVTYVLIAALALSFHMHGMFNGRIYKSLRYKHIENKGDKNNG